MLVWELTDNHSTGILYIFLWIYNEIFLFLFLFIFHKGVYVRRPFERYLNLTMKGDESWKFNIDWWHKFQIVKGIVDFHFSLIQNRKMIMLNFSFLTSPPMSVMPQKKIISFSFFMKKISSDHFLIFVILYKKIWWKIEFSLLLTATIQKNGFNFHFG